MKIRSREQQAQYPREYHLYVYTLLPAPPCRVCKVEHKLSMSDSQGSSGSVLYTVHPHRRNKPCFRLFGKSRSTYYTSIVYPTSHGAWSPLQTRHVSTRASRPSFRMTWSKSRTGRGEPPYGSHSQPSHDLRRGSMINAWIFINCLQTHGR